MFATAIKTAQELFNALSLPEGYVFQCEFLAKPKHNVLAYGRVPQRNLVLFDVRDEAGNFATVSQKFYYARLFGLEPVPVLYVGSSVMGIDPCRPPNPKAGQGEVVQGLINSLRTEARWLKAIQHLREAGALVHDNKDIGPLCREIQRDVLEEEADWIKQKLFDAFAKDLTKGVVQGFAQYYQKLVTSGPSVFQQMKIDEAPKVIVN